MAGDAAWRLLLSSRFSVGVGTMLLSSDLPVPRIGRVAKCQFLLSALGDVYKVQVY